MITAFRRSLLACSALTLGLVLFAPPVAAQDKKVEAAVRDLHKKAMEDDYLATDFDKAETKLTKAVEKCGAPTSTACSPQLRAQVYRDLATVRIVGKNENEKGLSNLVEALKADPTLTLDPQYKTKELEAAFEQAKRQLKGGSGDPSGDFKHTPIPEQLERTPVPIYAEYTGSEAPVKVVAKYKGFGMTEWKTLELKKVDKGFGAMVPCVDALQGEMQYYLQGFDAKNDPVATSGSRKEPFKVAIKGKIAGETAHLPGQPPPKQCQDTGDCPPDFPGCKAAGPASTPEPSKKSEGENCDKDDDCISNACKTGVCAAGEESVKFARIWVGIAGGLDWAMAPLEKNVCSIVAAPKSEDPNSGMPINTNNYYCVNADGSDYPNRKSADEAASIVPDQKGNSVDPGGFTLGTMRVMLSLDYAINPSLLVGGRLGYVFNAYPGDAAGNDGRKPFPPVHLEARGTYLFGNKPLTKKGVAPYVLFGAGVQEVDAKVEGSTVAQTGTPSSKKVDIWRLGGPGFIAFGAGVRWAFTPRAALFFAPKFTAAFGTAGFMPVLTPELGAHIGF